MSLWVACIATTDGTTLAFFSELSVMSDVNLL